MMKNKVVSKIDAVWLENNYFGLVCGIIPITSKQPFKQIPRLRFQNHYYSIYAINVEKCLEECTSTSECKAVSFGHSSLKCYFYNNNSPLSSYDDKFTSLLQ